MAIAVLEPIAARVIAFFGFAGAAREVVAPVLNELEQDIWESNPTMALDATTAAEVDAQGIDPQGAWAGDALKHGVNGRRYEALVKLKQGPPPEETLIELERRGLLDNEGMLYALRRLGVEERFHAPIMALIHARLSPADVANAIQQGFLKNPGILPVSPPTTPGKVPSEPPIDIDPIKEAEAFGVDKERLTVLARLAGLPPGPGELLEMVRRGKITEADFRRGVAQGHTKTEWSDVYLEMLERPLSAAELAILVIKQWLTREEAHARAKAAGISTENLDLIISGTGRPPGPAQLQTAVNRGLIDPQRFHKGIAESDVRPEWADTLLAMRVRYPTTFALRQLVATGAIPASEGERILKLEGWEPELARKVSHAWSDAKATRVKELSEAQVATLYEARYLDRNQAADMLRRLGYPQPATDYLLELADARRVKHFLDTAVGKLHALFISHRLGEQKAVTGLNELGISSQAVDDLMATWKLEREANLPGITPAEITGAVHYGVIPRERGVAMLVERGYSEHDAHFKIDVRQHSQPAGESPL